MLKKHKQFVKDVGTIIKEGAKVRKLKADVKDRQNTVKALRGTSGRKGQYNQSNNSAGVLANNPDMFNAPKRKPTPKR